SDTASTAAVTSPRPQTEVAGEIAQSCCRGTMPLSVILILLLFCACLSKNAPAAITSLPGRGLQLCQTL
ncbi:hypothetical protein K6U71_18300, partial [Vibrio alginolyticus]|nr:hypothetical protein [Vibrio alginolyticus]